MQIGVVYPQTELAADARTARTYVERVEELGYRHLVSYDHVLGADPDVHSPWSGPYDVDTTFHEPLVFYGFLAAITNLELVTGIIIAPQRQTALLAKQSAEVDILSEGRFRLGIGIGWNKVEYDALRQDFTTRGQREEEQIVLLRRLWTERTVTHDGRFDRVVGAGLAPLPVQRPIPVWLGGNSRAAFQRIGRLADGWFPEVQPGPQLDEARTVVTEAAKAAGRDPSKLGMEGRVSCRTGGADELAERSRLWQDAGATHLSINTMGSGLSDIDAHLEMLDAFSSALSLAR